ncbi:MAG TPA: IDEAL domain-containing protein [Bacillota bacterium]|nr:IDEAL domain-containing protein [Bacillota bacterium]
MLTVKMLKPYYIKTDNQYIRVILAYQYFAIFMNGDVYQFIPKEEKEIKIDRATKKVVNLDSKFAFQRGKDVIYITMADLISLPDFLAQLDSIVETYYTTHNEDETTSIKREEIDILMEELEGNNIRKLIDQALDEKDEQTFYKLSQLL